jgi:Flp pilus assembly CpaE family ATPase
MRALLDLPRNTEYTVIDVPQPNRHPRRLEGQVIVMVTTQELPAVRSAAVMAGRLRQRYGKDRVMVVMSRHDRDSEISQQDIENVLGMPIAHMLPSDYRLSTQSLNAGRPLVLDNHSELSGRSRSSPDRGGTEAGDRGRTRTAETGWLADAVDGAWMTRVRG